MSGIKGKGGKLGCHRVPYRLNLEVSNNFKYWLAGLIDGDGSFKLLFDKRNSLKYAVRISLAESDKFVLDYVVSTIGGKLSKRNVQHRFQYRCQAQYEWRIDSFYDCLYFADWILPALFLKKETAQKFLQTLKEREKCQI